MHVSRRSKERKANPLSSFTATEKFKFARYKDLLKGILKKRGGRHTFKRIWLKLLHKKDNGSRRYLAWFYVVLRKVEYQFKPIFMGRRTGQRIKSLVTDAEKVELLLITFHPWNKAKNIWAPNHRSIFQKRAGILGTCWQFCGVWVINFRFWNEGGLFLKLAFRFKFFRAASNLSHIIFEVLID